MKQKKFFIGLASLVAAVGFTACSSDDADFLQRSSTEKVISLTSSMKGMRSTSDQQTTALNTENKVGVFVTSGTSTITNGDNNQHSVESTGSLSTTNAMSYPNGSVNIYAYAPYQAGWNGKVSEANEFSVSTDQSGEGYLASDLLYGVPESNPVSATDDPISLNFTHKLAKINVTITKATGSNVNLANAIVKVINTKPTTTLNPSTGALGEASGTIAEITASTIAADLTAGDENSKATACAIVVPQELAVGTQFIKIITSDSKTLVGKLGTATEFESGESYSIAISVGNVTEEETEVTLSIGSTSITTWNDNTIGLTAYGVGDYVLADGTFMKKENYESASAEDKAKVTAIIFSTKVSAVDAAAGYNAYAVGVKPYAGRTWNSVTTGDYQSTNITTATTTLSAGIDDLDGKTKTATLMEKYYPSLTSTYQNSFVANLTGYSISTTGANLSNWFLPSFGQMVLILNEFGGTSITKTFIENGDGISSGSAFFVQGTTTEVGTTNPNLATLVNNLNNIFVVGGENQFTTSNVNFSVSTENGGSGHETKIWLVQFEDSKWKLTKGGNRNGNSKTILPCLAIKDLPILAEKNYLGVTRNETTSYS